MREDFERRLAAMVARVKRKSEIETDRRLSRLGHLVREAVSVAGFEPKRVKKIREACQEELRELARLLDACEFINWSLLSAPNGRTKTIPVRRGDPGTRMRVTQASILDLFRKRKVPNRGQCYVAWSRGRVKFFYVGKGRSKDRLDLRRHGGLADALASATALTLVFPAVKAQLGDLEASLMAVITADQGKKPTGIVRMEKAPMGSASRDLRDLGDYLAKLAKSLRPRRVRKTARLKSVVPGAHMNEGPPEVPPAMEPDTPHP